VQRRVGSRGGGDPPAANAAPSGEEEEGRQWGREHGLRVAGEGELHGRQGLAGRERERRRGAGREKTEQHASTTRLRDSMR